MSNYMVVHVDDQRVTAPLIPLVGDAKTMTFSKFPAYGRTVQPPK